MLLFLQIQIILGKKFGNTISEQVPGCKHAFIPKEEAIHKHGKGVGVEHASPESIRRALKDAQLMQESTMEEITYEDLIACWLNGRRGRKGKARKIGQIIENWLYKWKTTS